MANRSRMSDSDIQQHLAKLPGWARKGDAITKSFTFQKFADGIGFVDKVAAEADTMDHHPDIDIRYTTVTMTLSTHSAGGLTRMDIDLAEIIDRLKR